MEWNDFTVADTDVKFHEITILFYRCKSVSGDGRVDLRSLRLSSSDIVIRIRSSFSPSPYNTHFTDPVRSQNLSWLV